MHLNKLLALGIIAWICAEPTLATTGPGQTRSFDPAVFEYVNKLQFLTAPPAWARKRSGDYQLDFSTADAAVLQQQQGKPVTFRGRALNITRQQGYYYGNAAVVRFGTQFYAAVRKIQFYFTLRTDLPNYPLDSDPGKKFISWWVSKISLCSIDSNTLQPITCDDFDPRSWKDDECMWNGGFESLGPEDPRLIIWPGKGLYVIFISKPWAVDPNGTEPSETHCSGPWAQQPWIMPLVTYQQGSDSSSSSGSSTGTTGSSSSREVNQTLDPWLKPELIRLQYIPDRGAAKPAGAEPSSSSSQLHGVRHRRHALHKEKNWNAFVYNNELYFSQSLEPHVVIKPFPNGTCTKVHQTDSPAVQALPARPKGNTQAVLIPAAVSGMAEDVYLGIVHVEVDRSYTNYFYTMQAHPPFQITAVSAPIPLVPGSHPRVPSWKHISFPMSLQLLEESQQLLIGYGSGDQTPRVRVMGLEDALKLFAAA